MTQSHLCQLDLTDQFGSIYIANEYHINVHVVIKVMWLKVL